MASAVAQIQKSAQSQHHHTATIGEDEMIPLKQRVVDLHVVQSDDVEVTCKSNEDVSDTTLSMFVTWRTSMHACRAQMGSQAAMNTRSPESRRAKAQPIITSVVRVMPSLSE